MWHQIEIGDDQCGIKWCEIEIDASIASDKSWGQPAFFFAIKIFRDAESQGVHPGELWRCEISGKGPVGPRSCQVTCNLGASKSLARSWRLIKKNLYWPFAYIYKYKCIYIYKYKCMCIYIYICMYMCVYIYI